MASRSCKHYWRTGTALLFCAIVVCSARAERVTDGLLVLYRFEDGGGTNIADLSGTGIPLDMTIADEANVTWLPEGGLRIDAPTLLQSALSATNIYAACVSNDAVTLEAWIAPESTAIGDFARIVTMSEDTNNLNMALSQQNDLLVGHMRTSLSGNDGFLYPSYPNTVRTQLMHVVATRDDHSALRLYIDGVLQQEGVAGGDFSSWDPAFRLSAANESTRTAPWLGELHLLAIYDRALAPSEVLDNYNFAPRGPPQISQPPQNTTVTEPEPATFSVKAHGKPTLVYQWMRDGLDIPGATNSSYTLNLTTTNENGRLFSVMVSNDIGVAVSTPATLTVIPYVPTPATIVSQPLGQTVTEPDPAAFSVSAIGDDPLYYQWRRDFLLLPGETNSTYTLDVTSHLLDDGAQFDVIVSNPYGMATSIVATLSVLSTTVPPVIVVQPQDTAVTEPAMAGFSVVAEGPGDLFYQWRRDTTNITGATGAGLAVGPTDADDDDGARFDCIVANAFGSVTTRQARLTVNVYVPSPPVFALHPQNVTVTAPAPAGFSVSATGNSPLSYQWRRNGTPIPGTVNTTYVLASTSTNDNGAAFDCVVSNPYGSQTSSVATLTVNASPPTSPPSITSEPSDTSVTAPAGAGFSLLASGDAPLSYQWRRNGAPIPGKVNTTYVLASTSTNDNGARFDCVVVNPYGSVTSRTAILTVSAPAVPQAPTIMVPPANVSVTAPEPAGFSVVASGASPLSYQWRRDGTNLPGKTTSTYVRNPTSEADDGMRVDVIVRNAYGSITSQYAVLTVALPNLGPPDLDPIPDRSVVINELLTFGVTATDDDGQIPTLTAAIKPADAMFTDHGDGTGTFSWRPDETWEVGDHTVRVVAADGQFNAFQDANIQVRSFTITSPTDATVADFGEVLSISWTGVWALGSVTIDLWKDEAFVRTLGTNLPASTPVMTVEAAVPGGVEAGDDYWISVIDNDNPDDYAWSDTFAISGGVVEDGFWEGATILSPGWVRLDWFGTFDISNHPWIYHKTHGWMYVVGESPAAGFWTLTYDFGWLYTSEGLAPNFYHLNGGTWLFYILDSIKPRWFYNWSTGVWMDIW